MNDSWILSWIGILSYLSIDCLSKLFKYYCLSKLFSKVKVKFYDLNRSFSTC